MALPFAAPKTKEVVKVLKALECRPLGADRHAGHGSQRCTLRGRNIDKAIIKPAAEINAYDVLSKRTMIITKAALEDVLKAASKPSGKPKNVKDGQEQTDNKPAALAAGV